MRYSTTDLLPIDRQRTLRRQYFMRLGVIGVLCLIFLTVVATALLFPTYVYLTQSRRAKEERLTLVQQELSSGEETALSSRLAALGKNAETLAALDKEVSVSDVVRSALNVSRTGIVITTIVYSPGSTIVGGPTAPKNAPRTLSISGIATTRNALRTYQLAMQNAAFAKSVDLPVAAYAKETDASFTITVTLAP
jgi:Tfp pilus assembly protein PilN